MAGVATTILMDGTPTNGSDAWIDSLVSGGAWRDGNGGTVTINWTAFQGTMDGDNSYAWTPVALGALREAMALWESVANIDFVEVSGTANADVKVWWGTETQSDSSIGWSDLPGFDDSEVLDILFNAQDPAMTGGLVKGGLGLLVMVHELGHLLGLAHPHDGGAGSDATLFPGVSWWDPYSQGTYGLNQGIYTTMGYNFGWPSKLPYHTDDTWGLQYGPMALDIAAVQAIYGANTNYAFGNNVYRLPTANGAGTYWSSIWDTGGVDTISNEGSSNRSIIDLRAATSGSGGGGSASYAYTSSLTTIEGGYTIARGVVIENAIGGSDNDTITGNEAVNRLEGGAGDDILDGGAGADTMIGGTGSDIYHVDDSGDVIVEPDGDDGTDLVYSSLANYTLGANLENLTLAGGSPTRAVNGTGNSLGNQIIGTPWDNVIDGGGGADALYGGSGNDRLVVRDLSFVKVDGGPGTDTLALGGAGLVLDLTGAYTQAQIVSIERIDLTGTGNNTLRIDLAGALSGVGILEGNKYVLRVERDLGDAVQFADSGWTKAGILDLGNIKFDRWTKSNAEVQVEQVRTLPLGSILLGAQDGTTGFKLTGGRGDGFGFSVASAGDVNGDGFDDVIVGINAATPNGASSGMSYVVFGKASGFNTTLDLATLNGSNGFKLSGAAIYERSGQSVASAGDVNGDGYDDLIIGAPGAKANGNSSGGAYVVFGKASGFSSNIDLASLNGSTGFKLSSTVMNGEAGFSVSGRADFNGDGFDDLIIGDRGANAGAGATYVVFGKASGFAANVDLPSLDGSNGFRLNGVDFFGQAGSSVASADMNGDGYADLIVGEFDFFGTGDTYVLFGKATGFAASVSVSSLDGTNGFKFSAPKDTAAGSSVASAGDVNGDGFEDIIIGARDTNANGTFSGASYVVFGKASGFPATFDLAILNGGNGFRLTGAAAQDKSGYSVSSAGDINGDGYDDLIVGAPKADLYDSDSGASYVVFGKASGFASSIDLSTLNGGAGFKLIGAGDGDRSGNSVSKAGDVNGDGYDDLIIGASHADQRPNNDPLAAPYVYGTGYVVFGGAFGGTVTTSGTAAAEILVGGSGNDVLTGGGGRDVFHAGAGDDRLVINDLAFRLADGGNGTDTLVLGGAGLSLDFSSPLVAVKLQGIERIDLTGTGDNRLIVDQLGILGGVGAVAGGKHVLVVERDSGDLVQFVDEDWTNAGSFTDAYGTFDRWVFGDAEVQVKRVVPTGVTIFGTAGDDVISKTVTVPGQALATDFNDIILGGAGADRMAGGMGDDRYYVDNALDVVVEEANGGQDWVLASVSYGLSANVEDLNLTGDGNIDATGNDLNNVLSGNFGNNVLDGRAGADTMTGGLGSDTYFVDDLLDTVREEWNAGRDKVVASVSFALPVSVEELVLSGTTDIDASGNDTDNVLTGNAGNNRLAGGAGNDTMRGGLGDDTYVVDSAGDVVIESSNEGTDTVEAWLHWTLGANLEQLRLMGAANLNGVGNALDNVLFGNTGNDLLYGLGGDDILIGGTASAGGTNQLWGGTGSDTASYVGTTGVVYADLAAQNAHVAGVLVDQMNSIENLVGGSGNDVLVGDAGANTLNGGAGTDYLYGQDGDDTLIGGAAGGAGANQLWGGAGADTASYVGTAGVVYADLAAQNAYLGGVLVDVMNSIENLTGGSGSSTLVGDAGGNVLTGGASTDYLYGQDGNDLLIGGGASPGSANQLWGGAGNDTASYAGMSGVVQADIGAQNAHVDGVLFDVMNSVENLIGGSGSDTLVGNALANVLRGGAGTDYLYGQDGNDLLMGGAASPSSANQLWGGAGIDTASYVGMTGVVQADLGAQNAHVDGVLFDVMNSIENLTGGSGNNTLVGNGGGNVLTGGAKADYLYGLDGDDTLIGGGAAPGTANQLWGGSGIDTASYAGTTGAVYADLGAQTGHVDGVLVDLMNAIENLTGGASADTLVGNGGANRLEGGAGGDVLWGKGGADMFVYKAYADSNLVTGYDIIADFVSGTSKLDLTALGLDASHVVIQSGGGATSLYIEQTAGTFDAATDLAIALVGANAINVGDILF